LSESRKLFGGFSFEGTASRASTMEVDAVLIGTSPLMLIRAAMLARKGDRVVLLERASLPGGSWRTIEVLGFQNVEVGVHLLENRPNLYGFLAEELQVELRSVPSKENFGIFFGSALH
jgi:phytoene dehydrogenase-like protein